MADILPAVDGGPQKRLSTSSSSDVEKVGVERTNALGENDKEEGARERAFNKNLRVLFLVGIAALILGWWISSTVLKATRDKWSVCLSRGAPCILKNPAGLYRRSSPGSS
jgi:hypothetical protein